MMLWLIRVFLLCILFTSCQRGEIVQTFYGPIEVKEPVLLELIHSAPMQRLKQVHQYGVAYYTKTHPEEYNRFDHSLGVFAILRIKGASLEEQIAGLLHDISHTAFSHVGDWIYAKENQENDYHSSIHERYLKRSGIEKILNRHGYQIEQISLKKEDFVMLEQPLPNLCADRIEYNIQGAYFQKFITKEEVGQLLADLSFENGTWLLTNQDLALKLSNFSLFMTEDCWGSAENFMTSKWLARAILQGIEAGIFSWDDFHYGIDQTIWDRLSVSQESLVQKQMDRVRFPGQYFSLVDSTEAETFIKFKCRGIDPWIKEKGQIVRLSSLNPAFKEAFQRIKQRSIEGWPVRLSEGSSIFDCPNAACADKSYADPS